MNKQPLLLAIDQGTTSSRAIVFDRQGVAVASAQRPLRQHYPEDGWVEHDPEEIWQTTLEVGREVLARTASDGMVAAIGIANQRETTVVWERRSGKPIHNAIVWQDRRTAAACARLEQAGHGARIREKTGLLLDAYFSGPKIAWILDKVDGARQKAEAGELAFGTIDSFLIWRLTDGARHLTDASNASRTLLFNLHTQKWDAELLEIVDVPASMLPQVLNCADDYGIASKTAFGRGIPIRGVAGDQQAALFGQACFQAGMIKSTYGTGCFMLMHCGERPPVSQNRLLSTVGYRLEGKTTYALEGSIFNAGTAIQWLRDGLGLLKDTAEIHALIESTDGTQGGGNGGVYMVPAFTGLGAPHWDAEARAAILGITRDTSKAQLVRAALEAVCYQSRDLLDAMRRDAEIGWGDAQIAVLRVDGGMAVNDWLLQFLADTLDIAVQRPEVVETTALGAACLAGLHCGVFDSLDHLSQQWRCQRVFQPTSDAQTRHQRLRGWNDAIWRVKSR